MRDLRIERAESSSRVRSSPTHERDAERRSSRTPSVRVTCSRAPTRRPSAITVIEAEL